MSSDTIKMTIKQKRLICKWFKEGKSIAGLAMCFIPLSVAKDGLEASRAIQQVIRDFMNGKFTLTPQRKSSLKCGKRT